MEFTGCKKARPCGHPFEPVGPTLFAPCRVRGANEAIPIGVFPLEERLKRAEIAR